MISCAHKERIPSNISWSSVLWFSYFKLELQMLTASRGVHEALSRVVVFVSYGLWQECRTEALHYSRTHFGYIRGRQLCYTDAGRGLWKKETGRCSSDWKCTFSICASETVFKKFIFRSESLQFEEWFSVEFITTSAPTVNAGSFELWTQSTTDFQMETSTFTSCDLYSHGGFTWLCSWWWQFIP